VSGQPEVREITMTVSEVPAFLCGRDVSRCNHLRQRHPLQDEALLVCAWPGCPEGTRNGVIQVAISDDFGRAPVLIRFERESFAQGARRAYRWKSAQ
jgi:hypothetical protein